MDEVEAMEAQDAHDEMDVAEPDINVMPGYPLGWGYLPTVEDFNSLPGTSLIREAILRKITRHGFRCPAFSYADTHIRIYTAGRYPATAGRYLAPGYR
jgi:hypothetical protein